MNKKINSLKYSQNKQKGIALLMSLVMLLLITVIGVGAVRLSMSDTQIAGNSIYSSLVFQGAESALNRSLSNSNLFELDDAALNRTISHDIEGLDEEQVIGGGTLNSAATIKYEGVMASPQINTLANSSKFKYQVFKVTAESRLQGTGAKDTHSEGRAIQIPDS